VISFDEKCLKQSIYSYEYGIGSHMGLKWCLKNSENTLHIKNTI